MRKMLAISLLAIVAAAVAISTTMFSPKDSLAQGGYTPPPNRGSSSTTCPPGNRDATGKFTKAKANDPRDKDVNGDGTADYFMGEWKFVDGDNDLIVREWCINKAETPDDPTTPQNERRFHDYFTQEIITSLKGVETPRISPGSPT